MGHKRDQCPKKKDMSKPFIFSVASDVYIKNMSFLDSEASSHMTFKRDDFGTF